MRTNTAVIFTESPGSNTFEVQDIPAISEVARKHGVITQLDNTWASPLYFKPFEHGVDVSIQAVTKYIVGHADVLLGSVTTNRENWKTLRDCTWHFGQCVAPDDLYLAQRGLRTMAVRLRQHLKAALRLQNGSEIVMKYGRLCIRLFRMLRDMKYGNAIFWEPADYLVWSWKHFPKRRWKK